MAQLFASVTSRTAHWALWNHVARDTARMRGPVARSRRHALFALLNVAIHDGLQTSHTSKFIYGFWRPVTAIQRADDDLNPLTVGRPCVEPAARDSAVPVTRGQHGLRRCERGPGIGAVHGLG